MSTFDDLMAKVLAIFPDAMVQEDRLSGEIVIYTGVRELENGSLESVVAYTNI